MTVIEQWLAGPEHQSGKPADLLASMEQSLAAYMQTLAQDDEEIDAPHLQNQHRGCPCCTGRGE
ncbi:hypothetical protein CAter282_0115 [Collimonas arenae]|uniref:Uncharacterized protein n=2 Tax=Collimonas arenae TaxID=279058 RepID=A0A127QCY9_9BURK|nr:hypothetical protein CAter282_0115 [Collimonas arenae]